MLKILIPKKNSLYQKKPSDMFFYFPLSIFVLFITACSSQKSPAPVVNLPQIISVNNAYKHRTKQALKADHYFVKKGETLYSIAWRLNLNYLKLAKLNGISPSYKIYPGQKLFLSQKSLKASSTKPSIKNSNKSTKSNKNKIEKKPIASKKKQAYGEIIEERKQTTRKQTKQTRKQNFSQKIKAWQWPVKGRVIKWFSNASQGNKGIDIAGHRGKKIKAAASGKVVYAGNALRGYGKLIIIKHNNDYLSAYAHNDKILVKEQQTVKIGDTIATMGDTGTQTVKLHFEVRFRGKSVNPTKYLPKKQ